MLAINIFTPSVENATVTLTSSLMGRELTTTPVPNVLCFTR